MPSQFTIQQILAYQKISQYLAGNDKSRQNAFKSGSFIGNLEGLLYMEGYLLQNMYTLNPSSSTLRNTAEYVLSLCGKYLQQAVKIVNGLSVGLPVITGPSNQSVNVGQNAIFSISVTGTGPFSYQWFLNGILIPGATGPSYAKTNVKLSDSGGQYSIQVTNSAGTANSQIATLTVTATLTAQWWYGTSDPYPQLSIGNDTLSYQISQNITIGQPIVITYPLASENNQFWVLRYPFSEADKTIWVNTPLNSGVIPDSVMRAIFIQNGYKYIVTRVQASLDSAATTLTYS